MNEAGNGVVGFPPNVMLLGASWSEQLKLKGAVLGDLTVWLKVFETEPEPLT